MFSIFKVEIKNCINRNEFRIMFIILLSINVFAFVNTCIFVKGYGISKLRSGYEMSILLYPHEQAILSTILFVLPLFAAIVYSDSFISDVKTEVYLYITTRVNQNKYIIAKAITVAVSAFLIIFIPFIINLTLSILTFPPMDYETNGLPAYIIEYIPEDLFNWLRIENPFLFSVFSITIISIFSSLYALLTYSISLIIRKNKLIPITIITMSYLIISTFVNILPDGYSYILTNLPSPTTTSPFYYFILVLILLFSSSLIIIAAKLKNKKFEIV
ncbi:MAG: hypothetical protein LIR50_09465 [Bacillota bacterium]|nr:hypothetical protein [Bacillota bacterium]